MNKEILDVSIGFLAGIVVCGIVFYYYYSKLYELKEEIKQRALEYYYENKSLQESRVLKDEFEKLANQTMQRTTNSFLKNSYESLGVLLKPFQKDISEFNNDIKNYYLSEAKERFALKKEIESLRELNTNLQDEAKRLSNALRNDNKFAGSWGEFVLESLLDKSGLRKGYEYQTQVDFKVEEGRLRPDALVSLPQGKSIMIDSKVSLKAYERYVNDKDFDALDEHINSIKTHIKELSKKSYHKLVDSIELVLLFVPIEGAYIEAMRSDSELFEYAYDKDIVLVTPTTLITVLKTVEYSWKKEYQSKNAMLITKKASKLYDKFVSFVDDMKMVENSLNKAKDSYESAFKKLSTGNANLTKLSGELKELENVFDKSE